MDLPVSMMPHLRLHQHERGSTLVYLALIMLVLIGFAGLALDGSHAYLERRHMQTAADAAALAGARELALGRDPSSIITNYVSQNRGTLSSWSIINDGTGIRVQTSTNVATWFARAVGVNTIPVAATSEAGFLPVWGAGNLLPMAVCKADVHVGAGEVTLLWDDTMSGPGNFGWLSWDGTQSLPYLEQNIRHPEYSGVWQIGDDIPGHTGTHCNPLEDALALWVNQEVVIPLYGTSSGICETSGNGSNLTYRVTGFGDFLLKGFSCKKECVGIKNSKCVWGEFIRNVAPGEVYGGSSEDYGLRDVRLLQ